MNELVEILARAVVIGIGGAALMDAWALLARRAFNIQGLDYALLGRWIGHLPRGRFFHDRIAAAPSIPGERALGWAAHYAIGVAFAVPLVVLWGLDWADKLPHIAAAPELPTLLSVNCGSAVRVCVAAGELAADAVARVAAELAA